MKIFKMSAVCLLFAAMFFAVVSAKVQAQMPQEILKQYISDLQKNPNDIALREKIIKLAQGMMPVPAIPAEAVKFANRGEYAANTAKTGADFTDAAEEYSKAVNIAPWVAGYYFNMGVLREKANQPQVAAAAFKLYLLAEPNAKDTGEIQKRIDGLEYAAEKAANESSPEALAKKQQDKAATFFKSLNGARFVYYIPDPECYNLERLVKIQGDDLVITDEATQVFKRNCTPINMFPGAPIETARLKFQEFNKRMQGDDLILEIPLMSPIYKSITISGDGNRVTLDYGGGISNVCVRK